MVAIVKKQLNSNRSMYEILQILSITIFEKTPMNTLFSAFDTSMIDVMDQKQLFLFDF